MSFAEGFHRGIVLINIEKLRAKVWINRKLKLVDALNNGIKINVKKRRRRGKTYNTENIWVVKKIGNAYQLVNDALGAVVTLFTEIYDHLVVLGLLVVLKTIKTVDRLRSWITSATT